MPKLVNDRHLLAFDYGRKHIGMAVGQLITKTASPLTSVKNTPPPDWAMIAEIIAQWDTQALIVGLPLNMDGSEQDITREVHAFITELKRRFELPVYEADERLSTVAAKEDLFEQGGYRALNKEAIDQSAARIILEQWMKHHDPT